MTSQSDTLRPPVLNVSGSYIRKTNWSRSRLDGADLSGADASGAIFRGADFRGAKLVGTILKGADLTDAVNLTEDQLADAIIDDTTRLPIYIHQARLVQSETSR